MATKRKPSGDASDVPDEPMDSELDQPVDPLDPHDPDAVARFGPPRVPDDTTMEPVEGECLLVDKQDKGRVYPLDASGGNPRTVVADGVIYERAGDTPYGRPIYRQPQT